MSVAGHLSATQLFQIEHPSHNAQCVSFSGTQKAIQETAQSAKCSSCKHEDQSLMPRVCVKIKPGIGAQACNLNAGEVKLVDSWGSLPNLSGIIDELQPMRDLCLKGDR